MSIHTFPPAEIGAAQPLVAARSDPAEPRAERQARLLRVLGDIGMTMAEGMEREALARAAQAEAAVEQKDVTLMPAPAPHRGADFARVARAVRLTFWMENQIAAAEAARLAGDIAQVEADAVSRAAQVAERESSALQRVQKRRDELCEITERALEAQTGPGPESNEAGEVRESMWDLTDQIPERELLDRPISELLAQIFTLVGLEPDWSLFEDEDWAGEEADTPGSPYQRRRPVRPVWPTVPDGDSLLNSRPNAGDLGAAHVEVSKLSPSHHPP